MGRPKALLPAGDRSFVGRILGALRLGGAGTAVVVVRPGQQAVIDEVVAAGGRAVINPRADDGQLSSLIAGLDAVDGPAVDGLLVTLPVDSDAVDVGRIE